MPYRRIKTKISTKNPETFEPKPNKRAKIAVADCNQGSAQPGVLQLTPILRLTTELLTKIPSYFPQVPTNAFLDNHHGYYPSEYCIRPDILRALSQTCKALRHIYLPLLWERLEVCTARFGGAWYKQVGETLEARCELLKRRPDLGEFVRVANVVLTRYKTHDVVPAFASCLATLPNIHTLRLIHVHSQMTTALKDGFKSFSFPQIHTVILPSHAHNILRCCPEVREVVCTEDDGSKLVSAMKAGCPKVEVLDGFRPDMSMMKRITKATPGLRHITLQHNIHPSIIAVLGSLQHLTSIDLLYIHINHVPPSQYSPYVEAIWDGSEPLTVVEGQVHIKYCDSNFTKAARDVLGKVSTNQDCKIKKMSGGKVAGSSKRQGTNAVNAAAQPSGEEPDENEQKKLRIRHRRITTQSQGYFLRSTVVEERFDELSV